VYSTFVLFSHLPSSSSFVTRRVEDKKDEGRREWRDKGTHGIQVDTNLKI